MSDTFRWIIQHGFDLISSLGIIAGLLFTAASFRSDTRSRRLTNLITLTGQHREIWAGFIQKAELQRVVDPRANLKAKAVTPQEAQFVGQLFLHLHCWFRAVQIGELKEVEGLSRDIRSFLNLPIPRKVWEERRPFYDTDFVRFVEQSSRR